MCNLRQEFVRPHLLHVVKVVLGQQPISQDHGAKALGSGIHRWNPRCPWMSQGGKSWNLPGVVNIQKAIEHI